MFILEFVSLFPQGRVQLEQGSLTIPNVSLSDAGMYQCVAENRHGVIFASAELSVIGEFSPRALPEAQESLPKLPLPGCSV